jgi:hypothetical protein
MGRACGMYGVKTNSYRTLVGKQEGKSVLDLGIRWENNIKNDLKEIG